MELDWKFYKFSQRIKIDMADLNLALLSWSLNESLLFTWNIWSKQVVKENTCYWWTNNSFQRGKSNFNLFSTFAFLFLFAANFGLHMHSPGFNTSQSAASATPASSCIAHKVVTNTNATLEHHLHQKYKYKWKYVKTIYKINIWKFKYKKYIAPWFPHHQLDLLQMYFVRMT